MVRKSFVIFVFLLASLTGCTSGSNEDIKEGKYGGTLIWGSIGDAKILNPLLVSDSASGDIVGLIYDSLIEINPNTLEPNPKMAKKWSISEDGLTYTFYLNEGIKFHDGEILTSEDVKFTFDTYKNPNTNAPNQADVQNLAAVEIIDDYTVQFNLNKPDCSFLLTAGLGIIPSHLYKDEDINTASINLSPIGSGPFKFKEWFPDDRVVVEAFDDYYRGRPYLDRIIYKVVPDNTVLTEQLFIGEVDVTGIEFDQVERFKATSAVEVYEYDVLSYGYLGYNLKNEFFKELNVRKAISHAIDKEVIVDEVFLGFGEVANVPMPPTSWAYNPNIETPIYNIELAKKILKDTGFEDTDGNGIIDKNGKEFSFTLMTNKGNKQREKIAIIIKDRLNKIGIEVKIQYLEWPTFVDKVSGKNFDAIILGWSLGIDPDSSSIWHSEKAKDFNFISYHNPKVNDILDKGLIVPGCKKEDRKKLYWLFQEEVAKDNPYLFLYYSKAVVGVNNKFDSDTGIEGTPIGLLWNVDRWYFKN